MEQCWPLPGKHFRRANIAILWPSCSRCINLRHVRETELRSCLRVHQWWEKRLGRMWEAKFEGLDVEPEPVKGCQSCWFRKCGRSERYRKVVEKRRRSPHAEVMAGKSQTSQIVLRGVLKKGLPAFVLQPEFEEGTAFA